MRKSRMRIVSEQASKTQVTHSILQRCDPALHDALLLKVSPALGAPHISAHVWIGFARGEGKIGAMAPIARSTSLSNHTTMRHETKQASKHQANTDNAKGLPRQECLALGHHNYASSHSSGP